MKVSGESGDVSGATVDSWKERLPDILQGYSAKDVWNLDETGCFWRALPDKGFNQRAKAHKGGKQSKQWITVFFFFFFFFFFLLNLFYINLQHKAKLIAIILI